MAKRKLLFRLQRSLLSSRRGQSAKGFTLLELLVTTAIAAGIVAGLLFIVVQIMGVDQREASKNETQREMQMALNYISTEMRDAVYVYSGDMMGAAAARRNGQSLIDFLPANLKTNSVPVIAFWKQHPFPDKVKNDCASGRAAATVSCTNGSSYALVVYSLSTSNPSNVWNGKARITRYALTEFTNDGAPTPGYINPGANNNNFETWPFGNTTSGIADLRTSAPGSGTIEALVDFVDKTTATDLPNIGQVAVCPDDPATAGADYSVSPPSGMLTGEFADVRSFYACVNTRQNLGASQDVSIYLRGNASGRPGSFGDTSFLPTLETRVLSRGVLGRVPQK